MNRLQGENGVGLVNGSEDKNNGMSLNSRDESKLIPLFYDLEYRRDSVKSGSCEPLFFYPLHADLLRRRLERGEKSKPLTRDFLHLHC